MLPPLISSCYGISVMRVARGRILWKQLHLIPLHLFIHDRLGSTTLINLGLVGLNAFKFGRPSTTGFWPSSVSCSQRVWLKVILKVGWFRNYGSPTSCYIYGTPKVMLYIKYIYMGLLYSTPKVMLYVILSLINCTVPKNYT